MREYIKLIGIFVIAFNYVVGFATTKQDVRERAIMGEIIGIGILIINMGG